MFQDLCRHLKIFEILNYGLEFEPLLKKWIQYALHLKSRLYIPNCVFSHLDGPVDAVQFDVEAASVTDKRAGLVPPPHGRLLSVAVRANRLRPGARTSGRTKSRP